MSNFKMLVLSLCIYTVGHSTAYYSNLENVTGFVEEISVRSQTFVNRSQAANEDYIYVKLDLTTDTPSYGSIPLGSNTRETGFFAFHSNDKSLLDVIIAARSKNLKVKIKPMDKLVNNYNVIAYVSIIATPVTNI